MIPSDYAQDRKDYIGTFECFKESHGSDSLVAPKEVEAHIYYMEEIGELKKGEFKTDPATLYDMRFVKKAVEKYPHPK